MAFEASADVWTLDTGDISVLGIGRYAGGEMLAGLFNFDTAPKTVPLPDGTWRDLHSGAEYTGSAPLEPCGYLWLLHI